MTVWMVRKVGKLNGVMVDVMVKCECDDVGWGREEEKK